MRLTSATVYALEIPFVEAFKHSARDRRCCDSIVVRVRDEAGTEGFGEGVPGRATPTRRRALPA